MILIMVDHYRKWARIYMYLAIIYFMLAIPALTAGFVVFAGWFISAAILVLTGVYFLWKAKKFLKQADEEYAKEVEYESQMKARYGDLW